MPGSVYVVDDDASFRTAIKRRLGQAGYRVLLYESAEQILDRRPEEDEPGCILLDVRMPGLGGMALHDHLAALGSTLPVVFLTGHPDVNMIVKAIKAGAEDFLVKPIKSDELLRVIERSLARHRAAREMKRGSDILQDRFASLTPRERQVFALIVQGKANKQVAHELGCSVRTVKAHRHRLMEKMRAETLADLVSKAERIAVLR